MTQYISLSNKGFRLLTKYSESHRTEALSTHTVAKVGISRQVTSHVTSLGTSQNYLLEGRMLDKLGRKYKQTLIVIARPC